MLSQKFLRREMVTNDEIPEHIGFDCSAAYRRGYEDQLAVPVIPLGDPDSLNPPECSVLWVTCQRKPDHECRVSYAVGLLFLEPRLEDPSHACDETTAVGG